MHLRAKYMAVVNTNGCDESAEMPSSGAVLYLPRTAQPRMSKSSASRDKFLSVWPELRDELVSYAQNERMPADAVKWFKDVSFETAAN